MAEEKTFYQVLSPLKHDGKMYVPVPSKTVKVELTKDEADVLKGIGVVIAMPANTNKTAA